MESFNGKYYTTNDESYTKKHNHIMDSLLWAVVSCDTYSMPSIGYCSENKPYYPINEEGVEILEHLVNCDLISVVAD